ncbi:hypothetical protein R5R35_005893 [Gryllus longicercus]|uniref:Uncharacterized protein n=2 Tax=Gryllus longicercus TaxID=2509291 RepID=A0AAN9YYZ8_9ORTH
MELQPLAGRYSRKMENAGFERDDVRRGCCSPGSAGVGVGGGGGSSSSTVEMSEVPAAAAGTAAGAGSLSASPPPSPLHAIAPPQHAINGNGVLTCSEHCTSLHMQHQKYYREKGEPPAPESPWHHLKTIFLVGTLVFLALWVLVYTLLSQLSVL